MSFKSRKFKIFCVLGETFVSFAVKNFFNAKDAKGKDAKSAKKTPIFQHLISTFDSHK